jgi:hypothetical protein
MGEQAAVVVACILQWHGDQIGRWLPPRIDAGGAGGFRGPILISQINSLRDELEPW